MRHVLVLLVAGCAASLVAVSGSAALSELQAREGDQERQSLHSSRRAARDRDWLEGRVRLNCLVLADHRLGDCRVVIESPSGRGLGEEAIRRAESYPPAPRRAVGSRVNIRMRLAPPD